MVQHTVGGFACTVFQLCLQFADKSEVRALGLCDKHDSLLDMLVDLFFAFLVKIRKRRVLRGCLEAHPHVCLRLIEILCFNITMTSSSCISIIVYKYCNLSLGKLFKKFSHQFDV